MSLDAQGILSAVVSHAMALGLFEQVNGSEPASAPGNGLTAAVWVDSIGPAAGQSGLASTTVRLVLNVRIYAPMVQQPPDAIDPNMLAAVDALMAAYSGDFTLGGAVRDVDLMGVSGTPLGARAGYLEQDGGLYRVYTITLPITVNDLWVQSP